MTPQVSKGLGKISMTLTIPCLLFSNAITCDQDYSHTSCPALTHVLRQGWPLLCLPILYVGLGLAAGRRAAIAGDAPEDFRRTATAACAFGNSTGLPITLLTAISSQATLAPAAADKEGNPLLFLSVYLVLYPILQWSVGAWLLAPKEEGQPPKQEPDERRPAERASDDPEETSDGGTPGLPLLGTADAAPHSNGSPPKRGSMAPLAHSLLTSATNGSAVNEAGNNDSPSDGPAGASDATPNGGAHEKPTTTQKRSSALSTLASLRNVNDQNDETLSRGGPSDVELAMMMPPSGSAHDLLHPAVMPPKPHMPRTRSFSDSIQIVATPEAPIASLQQDAEGRDIVVDPRGSRRHKCGGETTWNCAQLLERIFPPPVIGAILGMVVALMHPVRGALVDVRDRDADAPLEWFFNGIQRIGQAAVPINMFILGNSLAKRASDEYRGIASSVSRRAQLAVALAKLVVMPACGAAVGLLLRRPWLIGDNSAALLVAMVVTCTPTANNMMVIAELAGENKEGLASSIFLQYVMAPFTITAWLTLFLMIANGNI
eukprot:CAMPEP_0185694270 /NCGR_PEP_ID=MMETSP1164-20130828/3791_1 /TAXON_ID=1104430 /ORGANISM="Chrysoreinhardia sp, Strain CCMP2950" /LENGTH=545 /DNA_ID=CAMNT_0028361103 /DNA_START=19 /DNA_END=1656 /DNA_ORIENTATION=+